MYMYIVTVSDYNMFLLKSVLAVTFIMSVLSGLYLYVWWDEGKWEHNT